jgi:hypothetical protein
LAIQVALEKSSGTKRRTLSLVLNGKDELKSSTMVENGEKR